ncbi:Sushi, von Willebrand factor type A, EGF and pentraxin domain-containing protein 1, partial [Ophiophagus hannah]
MPKYSLTWMTKAVCIWLNRIPKPSSSKTCPAGNSPLRKEGCNNGSSPIPCPEGTFRSAGLSSSLTCLACPVNFFSAEVGQVACLPCGSEAVQPKEGQNTCVCLRQGRVFQPSDAQCPCAPGYRSLREDRRWDCVQETYDICRDDAIRNQDGQCLTKEEWAHYCSDQVCDIPQDYQGYDKVLGLCLCQVGSLDNTCGLRCRQQQRGILKFFCEDNRARLSITYKNGRQVDIFWEELAASLQGLIFHAQNLCASETQVPQPVYMVKTNGRGFVGVNDPEPEALQHLFATQSLIPPAFRNELWTANSWDISWTSAKSGFRFSQPEPANATPKSTLTGILNPTVCLQMHEILMFIVSKDHYPVYDVNNLYNTNQDFDWGAFRKLTEEMQLAPSYTSFFFFLYQFYDPGTYVFRLSSNQHKKMVADLVLKPDWPAVIGIFIALVFLILIYLVLICKLWDSEDLIDLDSFNTNVFFEILLTQSLAVTTKLSQFKEELKSTYFKLLEDSASLRDLWVAKMCIPDGGKPCSDALMGDYMKVKEEAEEEIKCRKHRAAEYEESLNRQINLLTQHLKHEEEHWVAFNSALQGMVRQVEMLDDVLSGEELSSNSQPEHRRLLSLTDAAIEKLISMLVKENHRLTQWGLLGEGTGAGLLNKEKTRVLPKDKLVEPGGSLKTEEVLQQDLATGLIMPNKDVNMLLANRSMKSASPDHFLHPGTGKLLPIAGNVGFDPIKSKLIPVVDLVSGIVVPLGGLQGPSGDLLLPGDPFLEPLSGKMARMQGLSLRQDKVEPHAGSYQVLLEANVTIAQTLVVKALQEYKDSISKDPSSTGTLPKSLNGPEEAMKTALAHKLDYLMYQLQNLEKQRDGASRVKRTGMIKYLSTEFWMPAVFGMKIPDPGSSELMVPVLGVECDWKTGQPIPLAGVTEDADGKGKIR